MITKNKKTQNKTAHAKNGNQNLILLNWNKGNSKYCNRIDTIKQIILQHNPHIFCIQEANIYRDDDIRMYQIPGYYLEIDKLLKSKGLARVITYVSHKIRYKRLHTLESDIEPVIWLEIMKQGGNKTLKIQNYYRQWQEMTDTGSIPKTKSIKQQTIRFNQVINVWSQQLSDEKVEVISMSDTNLNLNLDYNTPQKLDLDDRKLIPLYRILNQHIFNKGASAIQTKPTKIHYRKDYTFIDHLITNYPRKIIHSQVVFDGSSDHLITKFTKTSKNTISEQKYRIIRKFSDVNWHQLRAEIQYDPTLQTAETSEDPQVIAVAIIKVIEDNLSNQAPLKKIQTNKNQPNFITPETKEILNLRDQALKKSKETKNQDDIRQFKTYRNLAHKLISKDKTNYTKNQFEKAQHNTKKLWQITKDTIGWVKNSSPNTISHQGKTYHSPKKIADIINFTQISRNISLHRNTPKTETDPTKNYQKLVKNKNLNFEIQKLSMRQLSQQMNEMKATPSSGIDNVSLRTIKQIYPVLKKSILNLVNATINNGEYPQSLKCAKIIPILKQNKPENDPLSYRCVNILPSLAKIIDRTLNIQIIKHLTQNKLLLHQHFWRYPGKEHNDCSNDNAG